MNFITPTKQGIRKCLAFCLSVMTWSAILAQDNSLSLADSLSADATSSPRITWYASVTTEMPWNISDGRIGWANYIEAGAQVGLWKGGSLDIDAIATYEHHNPVLGDLQWFSNITIGENKAFRLMQFGLTQQLGDKGTVSAGLRNTDIDCFTSPYTMLFTNSSYTSFPTLSFNFPLATAPVAALALHAEYQPIEKLTIKETLYNGVADDRLNRQFRFCPQSDGLINITSIHYSDEEHYTYSLGAGLGNSGIENEESGTLEKPFQYALWLLAEQELCTIGKSGLGLMLQGSIAPKESSYCSHYWGAGLVCNRLGNMEAQVGLAVNRVLMSDGRETDVELTASLPVCEYLSLQPALHCINTNSTYKMAALIRASFEIGN